LALIVLATCIGCEPSGIPAVSSTLEETNVKGVVRLRGKPVSNGYLEFNASNVRRLGVDLRKVPIHPDGTYTAKTLVGENSIHVSFKELFTAKNRMFLENEFAFMAQPGENTFDIDLGPAPSAPSGGDSARPKKPSK
jgi:hypothetical protein